MTTIRRGRQYPDGPLEAPPGWPQAAGGFLQNMLGADGLEPGPPYVHTYWPPEPDHDEDGNEIWPEPGPAITIEDSARVLSASAARL